MQKAHWPPEVRPGCGRPDYDNDSYDRHYGKTRWYEGEFDHITGSEELERLQVEHNRAVAA